MLDGMARHVRVIVLVVCVLALLCGCAHVCVFWCIGDLLARCGCWIDDEY